MKRHQYKLLIVFVLCSAVLSQYQNCGSSKGLNATEDQTLGTPEDSGDGDRSVINPVVTGDIKFLLSKTVVASSAQNVSAYGTCAVEHQGAQLSWKLFDEAGNELFKGKSICDKGVFQVDFQGAESLSCGANLVLKAYFGAQAETQTTISKDCG